MSKTTRREARQAALNAALIDAVHHGHVNTVRPLLRAGADVHVGGSTKFGDMVLGIAAANGHTEVVRQLLEAGARTGEDSSPACAWRRAAENGHRNTVKAILDWPTSPKTPNPVLARS